MEKTERKKPMKMRWILTGGAFALSAGFAGAQPDAARYCADLQQIVRLSASADRFASITGGAREGNFHSTTLSLPGWSDCTVYAQQTYACDSEVIDSAEAAQGRLAAAVRQIKACFPENSWAEDAERSSQFYVVLHHSGGPTNITISTDEEARERHFVRFILFVRR